MGVESTRDASSTATRTSASVAPVGRLRERVAAPLQLRDRDRYDIIGEHGRGGLGRVSRARDKELGRDVAIKELITRGDIGELRFMREALITARLEHPGIVPIHEAGCWDDGTPFYAMKLVSGRPLKELISERPTIDARLGLLHHVIAVADAIAYAHGRRIIHRDLKPSNIIVGDFGETVVIDWGLAKDLAVSDELPPSPGPYQALGSGELTSVGSVVGTPAYMAPEQARGEAVDQRVDVFAIGAMLWELCARNRVPPDDPQLRVRQLRQAGIDGDLAIIVCKALAPRPDDRYSDAGALAADLKAFQVGSRITARNYSLFAVLAHWTRRRRRAAVSVAIAVVLAIAGVVVYVRNIAIERDRADAAALVAHEQQRRAEQSTDEIKLQHAELQLRSDPTATLATLADYHGSDTLRLHRLRAEAIGRGVALEVLQPHADTILFLAGDPSGATFSLSEDRSVRLTHGGTSTPLADDVAMAMRFAYAPTTRTFAYAAAPSGVRVITLDATRGVALRSQAKTIEARAVSWLAIAPDGSSLAIVERDDVLTVSALPHHKTIVQRMQLEDVLHIRYAAPDLLIVQQRSGLRAIAITSDRTGDQVITKQLAVRRFDADPQRVAVLDDRGTLTVLSRALEPRATLAICRKTGFEVALVPNSELIAIGCEDGFAAIVRYDAVARTLKVIDEFPTGTVPHLSADAAGRYVFVFDGSSTAQVYDVGTRIVTRLEGQGATISFIAPPSPGDDRIRVGDVNGGVRTWVPPSRAARMALQAPRNVMTVLFSPGGDSIITASGDRVIRQVRLADGAVTESHGHGGVIRRAHYSPDGRTVVSYATDGTVRVWKTSDGSLVRQFTEHRNGIAGIGFLPDGRIASAGDDGRVLVWSPVAGEATATEVRYTGPRALIALEVLAGTNRVVVADTSGAIWEVLSHGEPRQIRPGDGAVITWLRASPDGSLLTVGDHRGEVTVFRATDWAIIANEKITGGIRAVRIDPHNRDFAIISDAGSVQLVSLDERRALSWRRLTMPARNISYSPDGEILAFVCADGGTWFYELRTNTWAYSRDHSADTHFGAFSPDGSQFASSDLSGKVTIRNIIATFDSVRTLQ